MMLVLGLILILIGLAGYLCLCNKNGSPNKKLGKNIPGPRPWPIIGSLHLMGNFKKYPFEAFTHLQKVYGSIFQIRLGSANAIVVHSEEEKREILLTKAHHFDGRPDFKRFEIMFGGDRRNSLAFCDFDKLQKMRRRIMQAHTFPTAGGQLWQKLDEAVKAEMCHLVNALNKLTKDGKARVDMKDLLTKACSNIFNTYFCAVDRHSYDSVSHNHYIEAFDKVFWEVNNGRAVDFLPWLMPAMWKPLKDIKTWTHQVRDFVIKELVENERHQCENEKSLMQCFLDQVEKDQNDVEDDDVKITKDIALYAMEDILGGHCAVANITLRAMIDIATRSNVQNSLCQELQDTLRGTEFSLAMKQNLSYTQATMLETVRMTCTPIVPHTSVRETSINGYPVAPNTVIFINNHYSNFSPELWEEPETYNPERFIVDGSFVKPVHFQPFSTGRRSCMGYKMVDTVMSSLLATIFSQFNLQCSETLRDQPGGMLALEPKPLWFTVKRHATSNRGNA